MQKFVFFTVLLMCSLANAAKEINVYSARKEALIKPLLDRFTEETGIKVNLVTGKGDALLFRLKSEGNNSPADILITTDVGRLDRAKKEDVLQKFETPVLLSNIPAQYRDSEGFWYGISLRSRVIVYSPDKVSSQDLSTYKALQDKKWHRRVCVRSSGNIYNQSLVASMIAHDGIDATEGWMKKFVDNFARPPRGGDRDQIKAVAAGQCDVALVNSYYLGAMLNSDNAKEKETANAVELFWPNQKGRGAHMNISGVALVKNAPNKAAALKLVDYFVSNEAQEWYAKVNHEFPVKKGVGVSDTLENWGSFKADNLALDTLGSLNSDAVKAMDRAGWK